MQVDKNLSFDQFSHDLTLALLEEETLRGGTSSRWGLRRRTRSTGNLPCPPQPTEDSSSSSPTDPPTNDNNNNDNFTPSGGVGLNNNNLSDSDDRHSFALAFKLRQPPMSGNFESDSLNENFSPSRPNIRRKRKFKRMAVEYETTPSTPHTSHPIFPISGTVTKKRVLKHNQENFRANLFFGKRKRPHRDRYEYYESHKHSSSVPRQRGYLSQKDGLSYLEYKSRNRASSMSTAKSAHGQTAMEKILPLNKSIVSKIEKISQDSRSRMNFKFTSLHLAGASGSDQIDSSAPVVHFQSSYGDLRPEVIRSSIASAVSSKKDMDTNTTNATDDVKISMQRMTQKSGSFESALPKNTHNTDILNSTMSPVIPVASSSSTANYLNNHSSSGGSGMNGGNIGKKKVKHSPTSGYLAFTAVTPASSHYPHYSSHYHQPHNPKHKQSRRKMQLQFDDQTDFMDCGNFNDFLSSSSLSSSDSEAEETNESDHEGDDELTDWPGQEAMINFASKNEFRRVNKKAVATITATGSKLSQVKQQDDIIIQDDDTLMSADEIHEPMSSEAFPDNQQPQMSQTTHTLEEYHRKYGMASNRIQASHPINIIGALDSTILQGSSSTSGVVADGGYGSSFAASSSYNCKKPIESEMSGETSNHFLSSPNNFGEIREIRAGCRRIRDERPGFSIITSFNEDLLKFLQDDQLRQLRIVNIQEEYDKILELAKLYSLNISREEGHILLNKTNNTMQAVKVSKEHNKYFFSDYKRRCVGGDTE